MDPSVLAARSALEDNRRKPRRKDMIKGSQWACRGRSWTDRSGLKKLTLTETYKRGAGRVRGYIGDDTSDIHEIYASHLEMSWDAYQQTQRGVRKTQQSKRAILGWLRPDGRNGVQHHELVEVALDDAELKRIYLSLMVAEPARPARGADEARKIAKPLRRDMVKGSQWACGDRRWAARPSKLKKLTLTEAYERGDHKLHGYLGNHSLRPVTVITNSIVMSWADYEEILREREAASKTKRAMLAQLRPNGRKGVRESRLTKISLTKDEMGCVSAALEILRAAENQLANDTDAPFPIIPG